MKKLNRRRAILGGGAVLAGGTASQALVRELGSEGATADVPSNHPHLLSPTGEVDLSAFNPSDFLYDFDYGRTSELPDGRTLREWEIVAVDKEIEVAPRSLFPGLDLQRAGAGPDSSLHRRRPASRSFQEWRDPSPHHPFSRLS